MADVGRTRSMKSRTAGIHGRRRRTGLLPKKKTSACRCPREEVSEKLEVLKKLVPSTRYEQKEAETEELFRETADYILRLKAQVVLLQNLIHIYENKTMDV